MWKYDHYWKYEKKMYINPLNKIWEYIHFTKKDKVICDFIDYVWFYGRWCNTILLNLLASDNWATVYVGRITLTKWENPSLFTVFWSIVHCWKVVNIFRLQNLQVPWMKADERYLKVDLYWKWVKLIREEWLWSDFYTVLKRYCWFDEIILTRADYTVDCARYNFNKKNTLKNTTYWNISKRGRIKWFREIDTLNEWIRKDNVDSKKQKKEVQYLLFWNKSSSTARFIRYYDKKAEILARWTWFLYPEYFWYDQIMRYELQVNSKWFDDEERRMKVEDVYNFIIFHHEVSKNKTEHKSTKNYTLLEYCKYAIKKFRRDNDYEALEQLKFLLFDPKELCVIDWVV